jgi:hypothetical protein
LKDMWAVVQCDIAASGKLLKVMRISSGNEETGDSSWYTDRVLTIVRRCSPFPPPPAGGKDIAVTELFWHPGDTRLPPGSPAERLSRLRGGRRIDVRVTLP